MKEQNLDGVLPTEPVTQAPDSTEPEKDPEDEYVISGSLSQAYTDILNKKFGKVRAVATESISSYVPNGSGAKPVFVYATDMNYISKHGASSAYDDIQAARKSNYFNRCVISVEHTLPQTGSYLALENMVYDTGMRVYRKRADALLALGV